LAAGAAAWANAALASAGASNRTSPAAAAERPDALRGFNGLEINGLEINGLEKSTRSSRMRKLPLAVDRERGTTRGCETHRPMPKSKND
jgi:hypothetical protein